MKLQKGMQVFTGIENISSQIAVNTGTRPVKEHNGSVYFEDSFIPVHTWRSLTTPEATLLVAKKANFFNYHKNLFVGEIPEKIKKQFQLLDLKSCTDPNEVYTKFETNKAQVKKINTELHTFLKSLSSTGDFKFHKITRATPNRETMTSFYVDENFLYVGLHIDQSKRFTIHTAHKSGNRISINLGNETRTLIFVNLTLIQVYNLVSQKIDTKKIIINPDTIAPLFFQHYPDYPVIKLAIKPYQFYVAPTDNFFHDAATVNTKEIDITIVYTGLFDQLS